MCTILRQFSSSAALIPASSYSILAAKIQCSDQQRMAGAFGARPLVHRKDVFFANDGAVPAPAMPLQGGPKGSLALGGTLRPA